MFHSLLVIWIHEHISKFLRSRSSDRRSVAHKDLLARHTRFLPTIPYFVLILVASSSIDVTVSFAKCGLNCILNFMRLGELCEELEEFPLFFQSMSSPTQVPRPIAGIS